MTEKSTALTVVQRAVAAIGITAEREKELRELAARTNGINAITNRDGYQQVHSGRMALKNERVSIQNLAKEARDDATKFSKAVIAEEKRIIAIISPEEDRLQKLQDEYDAAIEAEKQAKIAAEQKRVRDLQELVEYYRGNQTLTASSGSALIAEHIEDLERQPVDESFQEFQEQAAEAKAAGLERLRALHAAAVEHEAEQARIKAEREELARLRAEQAKREEEARAEAARVRAEEEKKLAAERARIAEEEYKANVAREAAAAKQAAELKAQREKQEAEAAAERKRIAEEEAAAKAIRDAEAAKLAAERAEFERQQAEARRIKEEQERAERERARLASIKKPTDDELLGVLAKHYNVPQSKVIEWILAMDLSFGEAA